MPRSMQMGGGLAGGALPLLGRRGIVRRDDAADLPPDQVGGVGAGGLGIAAVGAEGLLGERDGDGDRRLLRGQVGVGAGLTREQRGLDEPVAGGDYPESVGVALVLRDARWAAGQRSRLPAQV